VHGAWQDGFGYWPLKRLVPSILLVFFGESQVTNWVGLLTIFVTDKWVVPYHAVAVPCCAVLCCHWMLPDVHHGASLSDWPSMPNVLSALANRVEMLWPTPSHNLDYAVIELS